MTRVGRLAGAIVVETNVSNEPAWYLVGDTKVPCDFAAAGFERPADRDVKAQRFVRLVPTGTPVIEGVSLRVSVTGEAAARAIAERLTVPRNGSVSERLWRLIVDEAEDGEIPSSWLCEMPSQVWDVVRDAVLKCS